jgi:hypothetical protein
VAALYAAWTPGSASPARDRRRLEQWLLAPSGWPVGRSAWVVACGLATSSALVAGLGGEHSVAGVARVVADGAFLVRRGAGPTGNTQHLVSWACPRVGGSRRRCYGPLCLGIRVAVATTLARIRAPRSGWYRCVQSALVCATRSMSGRLVPDGSPLGVRSAMGIRDADSLSAHSSESVSPTEMLLTKTDQVSDDGVAAPDCA